MCEKKSEKSIPAAVGCEARNVDLAAWMGNDISWRDQLSGTSGRRALLSLGILFQIHSRLLSSFGTKWGYCSSYVAEQLAAFDYCRSACFVSIYSFFVQRDHRPCRMANCVRMPRQSGLECGMSTPCAEPLPVGSMYVFVFQKICVEAIASRFKPSLLGWRPWLVAWRLGK